MDDPGVTMKFMPSQKSYENDVSPFTFRLSPMYLLAWDFLKIISLSPTALGVLLPLSTTDPKAEFYLNGGNMITMIYHLILFFFTITGFLTVFVLYWLLWPMELIVAYIAGIVALCFPSLSSKLAVVDRSLFALELGPEDHCLESRC